MFWGKGKDKGGDQDGVPRSRDEPRPEFLKDQIPRQKLPRDLQQLVDREDEYYDELYSP
jgi:mitochondrial fission process protein 1